ncbi:hypothetical protein AQ505_11815 [Pedobacter sp. PACM 27299]|uniref:hypothetical protein n=1 Tax=Pedobacter sp. PACM 27299 TaxID=1727164 RepID=UPI000705CD10|nr:hypothetical protein [Pedobacter sp. PACM 27299]ALL06118.1 hypothetical protein AQ505_11815 [Pedobacter sp. PACM 27299]
MSKTILITVAASGFGKIAAFDLAEKGHKVIATTQVYPQMSDLIRKAKELGIALTVDKLYVALGDQSNFRNVHPKETEDFVKQLQAAAWTAKSSTNC